MYNLKKMRDRERETEVIGECMAYKNEQQINRDRQTEIESRRQTEGESVKQSHSQTIA